MNSKAAQKYAGYFNTPPELVPFLPELLSDLWALGSSPQLVVEWLRPLNLPPNTTRVLDLGCGKGAVSVLLAKELTFRVHGVDFFEPFVIEARRKADEYNVARLCRFEVADIHKTLRTARDFDVGVYTAVGNVLGTFDECVWHLRQSVRKGGYILIDDGFRRTPGTTEFPGYEQYSSYEETLQQLTAHGDSILREKILSTDEIKAMNRQNTEWISNRVESLARSHPELAPLFQAYLEKEKQECEILETDIASAVWLLQKA